MYQEMYVCIENEQNIYMTCHANVELPLGQKQFGVKRDNAELNSLGMSVSAKKCIVAKVKLKPKQMNETKTDRQIVFLH